MTAHSKMNPDIQEEREKVSFNLEEFTNWYHGGVAKVEEKRFLGVTCLILSASYLTTFDHFQKNSSCPIRSSKTASPSATWVTKKSTKSQSESRRSCSGKSGSSRPREEMVLKSTCKTSVTVSNQPWFLSLKFHDFRALLGGMLGTSLLREGNPMSECRWPMNRSDYQKQILICHTQF